MKRFSLLAFLIVLALPVGAQDRAFSDDRSGFVVLTEAVPDVIVEVRYHSTYNFVGARIDGYEEPVVLLTREAAQALKAVSDEVMAKGYRLKVFDGYRPQMAVDHFVRWARDISDTRMKPYFYPAVDKRNLFSQGYIASHSGHTRGSTVDLTLLDMATGKEVDMGGVFDLLDPRSHPSFGGNPATGTYIPTAGITEPQFRNRMILREAMVRQGFRPLSTEWWHFTLRAEPYPNTYFTFPVRRGNDD